MTFNYKSKWTINLFVAVFFGIGIVVLVPLALTNNEGLNLKGITFSQSAATAFYWVLSIFTTIFAIIGVLAVVKSWGAPRHVILTDTHIRAPKAVISNTYVEIPFVQITDVSRHKFRYATSMEIRTQTAKLVIYSSTLANQAQFDVLYKEVMQRRP